MMDPSFFFCKVWSQICHLWVYLEALLGKIGVNAVFHLPKATGNSVDGPSLGQIVDASCRLLEDYS